MVKMCALEGFIVVSLKLILWTQGVAAAAAFVPLSLLPQCSILYSLICNQIVHLLFYCILPVYIKYRLYIHTIYQNIELL